MPFCGTRLSAKRFIAGVGGYVPAPLCPALPSKEGPPAVAPSFSLLIMRSATSHTASIAPTISCLPTTTSSSRHSSCAVTPGSTSAGSACLRTPNNDRPVSVVDNRILPLRERARNQTPRGIAQLLEQTLQNPNHIGDDKAQIPAQPAA